MGYNYERGLNEEIHNFGHRAESVFMQSHESSPKFGVAAKTT